MKNRDSYGKFAKGNSVGPRFTSEKQPENPGRKGKSINEYLKELGGASSIEFSIIVNHPNGNIEKGGKVESLSSLNELLATLLFYDAIEGDFRAQKEILDRTEGRPKQMIDLKPNEKDVEQPMFFSKEELETRLIEIVLKSGIDIQKIIDKYNNSSTQNHQNGKSV